MRVLVVMPGVGPEGGAEQSFAALAPELVARGMDLHLAVLSDYQTLVPALERDGVVIHDLSSATSLPARVLALRTLVRRLDPAVVHATLWDATLPTQMVMATVRTPLLITWAVTPASDAPGEGGGPRWKRRAAELVDAALGRISGARYHAVTAGVSRTMARALAVPQSRVMVGERGRQLSSLGVAADRVGVLSELGLDPDRRLVLAVGRQDPQKGYATLLDAFDLVAARVPEVELAIAGRRGAASDELERRVAGMEHSDRVHLLGQRDDVPRLLSAADVVACASWREGASGAVVEALASGVPVVAVRLDGLEGVLVDGDNARVVDRAQLAEGLVEVLTDQSLAERLGAAGQRCARERFTVERSADRMVQIYRWASDASAAGADEVATRSSSAQRRDTSDIE